MTTAVEARREARRGVNALGLTRADYKGLPSTLCQGCGHNSISSQIIAALWENAIPPYKVIKMSGIGCSSKSPAYFLGRAFGFNSLHGRMPSVTTGAAVANKHLLPIGISGDGDTASIGIGQFIHLLRRNVPMVYIVENNGVYGLTKGQFSATADKGARLKKLGENPFLPVDVCMEALVANCGFVARSFAGDPKQVKELIKAALSYQGTAVLDIISPCVTFNNRDESTKSYSWGRQHEDPLHDVTYVPRREDIRVQYEPDEQVSVELHDGSYLMLKKLARDYDPTDRMQAIQLLEEARTQRVLITGLIYIDREKPSLQEIQNLVDEPLSMLPESKLRPPQDTLQGINQDFR